MKRLFAALGAFSLIVLVGCDVKSRGVPVDDPQAITSVIAGLSPWKDGSPDQSNDSRHPGEPGSDRRLFREWIMSYHLHRQYDQYSRDYEPRAVPSSVAAAIEEQRMVQNKKDEIAAAQAAESRDRERRETAMDRQRSIDAERASVAYEAKLVAGQAARQISNRSKASAINISDADEDQVAECQDQADGRGTPGAILDCKAILSQHDKYEDQVARRDFELEAEQH